MFLFKQRPFWIEIVLPVDFNFRLFSFQYAIFVFIVLAAQIAGVVMVFLMRDDVSTSVLKLSDIKMYK